MLAHDLKAEGTTVGLRFKSAMNRGGTTSHIYLRNIEMKNVGTVIEATMNWNPAYSYSELPEKYAGTELPDHWKKMLEKVNLQRKGFPISMIFIFRYHRYKREKSFQCEGK